MARTKTADKVPTKSTGISIDLYELLKKDAKRCRRTPQKQLEAILSSYFSPALSANPEPIIPAEKSNVIPFPKPNSLISVQLGDGSLEPIAYEGERVFFQTRFNKSEIRKDTICCVYIKESKIHICTCIETIGGRVWTRPVNDDQYRTNIYNERDIEIKGVYYPAYKTAKTN